MTREDLARLSELAPALAVVDRLGLLSPNADGELALFPHGKPIYRRSLRHRSWDLDRPGRRRYDVLLAANVFMYSADPQRWFDNVLARCQWFVLQDIVRRRRSPDGELGPDGDRMRYAAGGERPRTDEFFDLRALGDRLLACSTYVAGPSEFDAEPLHVLALIRGDLTPSERGREFARLAAPVVAITA
jgi:hypothetical protein